MRNLVIEDAPQLHLMDVLSIQARILVQRDGFWRNPYCEGDGIGLTTRN